MTDDDSKTNTKILLIRTIKYIGVLLKGRLSSWLAVALLERLPLENRPSLQYWRSESEGFNRRLHRRWKDPFNHLELFILTNYQLGKNIRDEVVKEKLRVDENGYQSEVLLRLHVRATRMSLEILTLIKNGYADGALARWRSLYEIALVATFIEKHGEDTAERFFHYKRIQDLDEAKAYQEYQDEVGLHPLSEEDIEKLEHRRDELTNQYGGAMADSRGWGWAAEDLGGSASAKLVAEDVGLDWLIPYYKFASNAVHGGPKGARYSLGIIDNSSKGTERITTGSTDSGFTDPAQLTMDSLLHVTIALAEIRPTRKRKWTIQILEQATNRIAREFDGVQRQIDYKQQN